MSERPALSAERYVRFVGLVMPSLLTASQLPRSADLDDGQVDDAAPAESPSSTDCASGTVAQTVLSNLLLEVGTEGNQPIQVKKCRRAPRTSVSLPPPQLLVREALAPLGVGPVQTPGAPEQQRQLDASPTRSKMRLSFGGQVKLLQSDEEIKAPISDIKILEKKDALPEGYFKIMKDLNFGSGGTALYLCVKKDLSLSGGKHAPIGALSVIFPGRDEFLLPGFELVKRRGVAVDLNTGTGEKVHLCFKRSWTPAITNISVVFPKKNEKPQEGYETIESTPKGHQADVNAGCVNNPVFLCIKRSFDNFEQIKWSTTRSSRAGAAAGGGSGESRPAQSRPPLVLRS